MNQDYISLYADFLKKNFEVKRPLTIVADCSNGTTSIVLKSLQNIPNVNIILINDTPDPEFPAHGPNPLEPGATNQASDKVRETKADFGVIFDADGDRAFFVDNQGNFIPAFIIATVLFKQNKPPFVAEELVYKCLEHMGLLAELNVHPSRVGTYFVKEQLNKISGSIGAEYSGHYYFKDFFNTDSGIFTMIQIANMVSGLSGTLSAFCESLPSHQTANEDIKLGQKTWADIEKLIRDRYTDPSTTFETREGLTIDFGDKWINIRPSNTEPLLRLFAGSKSSAESTALIDDIKLLISN